jgi:hypothetical protein
MEAELLGDIVIIHTGWGDLFEQYPAKNAAIQGQFRVNSGSLPGGYKGGTPGPLLGQETACRRRGPRAHDGNRPRGFGGCRGPQPPISKMLSFEVDLI